MGQVELAKLMKDSITKIRDTTDQMLFEALSTGDWFDRVKRVLAAYHIAAYLDGSGVESYDALSSGQKELLARQIGQQFDYLEGFADDIENGRYGENPAALKARAMLYSMNLKSSWWSGKTNGWPLPAMPGDGTTQCIVRCCCRWEGKGLNEVTKTGDWYWRMNSAAEHCQTCSVRSQIWSPLRIQNGEIV